MLARPPPDPDMRRAQRRARDRKHYRRQTVGRAVAPVEYSSAMVDYLVKWRWLDRGKDKDRHAIGDAISRAMLEAAEADE
jgi:hypothetical protein